MENTKEVKLKPEKTATQRMQEAFELIKHGNLPYGQPEVTALMISNMDKRRMSCGHPLGCMYIDKNGNRGKGITKCGWCEDRKERFQITLFQSKTINNLKNEIVYQEKKAKIKNNQIGWLLCSVLCFAVLAFYFHHFN